MTIKDKYKECFKNINPDEDFINSMIKLSEIKEKTEISEYKSEYKSESKRYNFIPVTSALIIITLLFTVSFVVAALIRKNGNIKNIVTESEITSQVTEFTEPQDTYFSEEKQYIVTEMPSENSLKSFDNEITETEVSESNTTSESTSSIITSQHYENTSSIIITNQHHENINSESIITSENTITSSEKEQSYQFRINDAVVSAGESAIIEITSDINFEWYIMYAHLFTDSDYIKIKNISVVNKNSIDCSVTFNPKQNSFIVDSLNTQNVNSADTTIYIEIYVEKEIPAGTYELGISIDEITDIECLEFIEINSVKHGKIIVH